VRIWKISKFKNSLCIHLDCVSGSVWFESNVLHVNVKLTGFGLGLEFQKRHA
jgi:hypothetical protein